MAFLSNIFGYVLNFFYEILNNYGLAIIIFSVLLRLILIPITIKQQKTMKKSAKIQEKMKEIQVKYKNNPEKLNQETIELYRTEKMSPFSGCFSAIIQLLIILSVFWLVSQPLTYMKKAYNSEDTKEIMEQYKTEISKNGTNRNYPEIQRIAKIEEDYNKINEKIKQKEAKTTATTENDNKQKANTELSETSESKEQLTQEPNSKTEETEELKEDSLDNLTLDELKTKKEKLEKLRINMNFLGLDLSMVLMQNLGNYKVYIIPLLYVVTSFISIKISTSEQKKQQEINKSNTLENEENKQQEELQESMKQMNNTMMYMMPIMSISIASIAPLGLALYWLVSNILIIIERVIINKIINSKGE